MADKPVDRAYEWTVEELAAIVKRLNVAAEVFEDFRILAEQTPTKTLASHNRLTLLRAITNLDSAVGAIQKAIWRYKTGSPLSTGELKPQSALIRNPKKKTEGNEITAKPKSKSTRNA